MLWDLHVKDLAVINELRLGFKQGLTVLSGDEGAGKSLLVDALCLLAGGKATTSLIRNGASKAVVEGIFDINAENRELASLLESNGIEIESDGTLIITREVHEQGKSIARVNGRAVPVSLLRELGQQLIDIHSQMEHLSLLNSQHQMNLLDCYGGLLVLRNELGMKIGQFRRIIHEITLLSEDNNEHECDLLKYQIAEIDNTNIQLGEDEALEQEHRILQSAQELKEYCNTAYSKLGTDDGSAILLLNQAVKALERASLIDPTLQPQIETIIGVTAELEEVARTMNTYMDKVSDSQERLQQVEERLALMYQLKRKYGATIEQILHSSEETKQRLDSIESIEERHQELESERLKLQTEIGCLAEKLSRAREEAAISLAKVVNLELAETGIPWASFNINLVREEAEDGVPAYNSRYLFTQNGIDRVQFIASTNPGEPLRPLIDIASGGETCRFMLALKSALRQADFIPTLIFDEIDSGVGGRNANTVGKKLAALAQNRQVICITHLPQIACFGKNHYRVVKDIGLAQSITSVEHLKGNHRIQELAAMLGGTKKPMLESAQELLISARQ
ncbi:DNA repair protein RecN [Chloroflexota bacterium]